MKNRILHRFIISVFISLYVLVATTSMINSVAFFDLSHNIVMSWTLAIGFELGAAASLAAILILDKTNKLMVWGLFVTLTLFQMMANTFHAYINLENYIPWVELFGLVEEEPMMQKRILSIVSGAILPLVALGFIKSLTDYLKPNKQESDIAAKQIPKPDQTSIPNTSFSIPDTIPNAFTTNPSETQLTQIPTPNPLKKPTPPSSQLIKEELNPKPQKSTPELIKKPIQIKKKVVTPDQVKVGIKERRKAKSQPNPRVRYKP